VQTRLAAPRAVPAVTPRAFDDLHAIAAFFERTRQDGSGLEGDLRRRSHRQRTTFEKRGIDEALFFSNATSTGLDSLRFGPKWAVRSKVALQMALAN